MLILPSAPKVLLPVPAREWREPSRAQSKDQFGNPGVQTRFRLRGRLHDGHTKFRLWFDSRDDADQFLASLARFITSGTPIPREDWGLVNEILGDPTLYPWLQYDFATVTFLSTTGSNQTYNKPSDWNDGNNSVEGLGGGASGGIGMNSSGTRCGAGGGAGAYSKIINFTFSGASLTYRVGSFGAGVSRSTTGATVGNNGTVTYFNASSDPGAGTDNTKLGAQPGSLGNASSAGNVGPAAGGVGTSGWGSTRSSGGSSGACTGTTATGGGGAPGPAGAGGNAADSGGAPTAGGSANNGATAGGAAGGGGDAGDGVGGTEWDGSHGSGSGGGGLALTSSGPFTSGDGGTYGGGSGGARSTSAATNTGNGGQGLIVVTYMPATASGKFFAMF